MLIKKQDTKPIADLGFSTSNNYPEYFISNKQADEEREITLRILRDHGELI